MQKLALITIIAGTTFHTYYTATKNTHAICNNDIYIQNQNHNQKCKKHLNMVTIKTQIKLANETKNINSKSMAKQNSDI